MAGFLGHALRTADVPAALAKADLGWGDYLRARREHPAFAVACLEVDQVVRQALWVRLESAAAAGDVRSIKLLNGGIEAIKASLADLGIAPEAPRFDPAAAVPRVRIGRFTLPQGPCAVCARGLMVHHVEPLTGRFQHVLVRHELMEHLDVEPYPGHETTPIILGFDPSDPTHERAIHPEDWSDLHPHFILPPHTGPTRTELHARAVELGHGVLSPRWDDAGGNPPEAAGYLPIDFGPGETPPDWSIHLYGQVGSLDGQSLVWKLLPEHRDVKHPLGRRADDA